MTDEHDASTAYTGLAALTRALGAAPPPTVAQLPTDALTRLAVLIESGRQRQFEAATVATDRALRAIPLPLRRVARKALTWL